MTNSSEFFKKLKKVDGGYQITLDDGSVIVGSQISDIIRQMMKKSNDEPSFKKISLPDNLKYFVPRHQIKTMASSDEFEDIANELSKIFEMMPKTYEQDGKGDNAKVYLHYFYGDSHWYIIEKDSEKEQLQMFGYAVLNGDLENAELGYISFDELNENNVELDFHFDIDTLGNIKKELNQRYTYARGGKLKKYDYVPNRNIESLELTKGNKTVDVDGADVIDGVYVKKGKYAKGGGAKMGKMARGGKVGDFEVGQSVTISRYNDNENYADYVGKELVITHKAVNRREHRGFDESMTGQGLYDFVVRQTGEEVPFSLYDYEIEQYAKGGGVMENKYAIYELAFGQPYNFYNEEQDKFIWSEPTKATLFTKKEAENKRAELLKPRIEYYQRTGKNYQELHIGDLFEKGILNKYANGGGVGEEKEYVVTLQHLDSGELIKFNVMGTNEDNAIDNAYMETDLNQPYEIYSVKKMANGGGVGKGYKGVRISHYKVGNKIFIDYMDAMEYCDENNISYDEIINTKEYARGGMSEHGLKTGDKITGRSGSTGVKLYNKNRKESGIVNLDKGIRKTNSYGKKEPTIVRGFVDDEPYEFKKGGSMYSRNASKSKNIIKKPIKKKKKKEPTIVRGFVDDEPYEFKKGGSIHSSLMDDFFN